MGFSTHASGTNDPPEVRNWRIHLIAFVASMSALASMFKTCFSITPIRKDTHTPFPFQMTSVSQMRVLVAVFYDVNDLAQSVTHTNNA